MRQEDHEFKTSLSYIVSLWSRLQKTSLKKKKRKKRKGKSSVKIILHDILTYMYADRENENNEI